MEILMNESERVKGSVEGGHKSGHGGARRGAGRKRVADRDCRVSFGLSVRGKGNLERYASEAGISLNEAAVRIFEGLYGE